jgi:uncharacterized MAPEG superfamily protein
MEPVMSFALWTLFIAALFPVVCAGIAKAGPGRYDNRNPRAWLGGLGGYQARAHAAQQNSWEAVAAGVDHGTITTVAGVFLVARIAYLACYLADLATLRSLVWLAGFGACLTLIVQAARTAA